MIIASLNTGLPRNETFFGKEIFTGICKQPAKGPLHLGTLGFENDGVGDLKHHGGNDKAVCVYSLDHYPFWENILGMKLSVAAFGENLTISHIDENDICIGDIFQFGTALVQVSQPRQPCRTLAARYGRDDLIKLVADSGRTGFYFRVLKEGNAEQGASLLLKEKDPRAVSVSFANRTYHHDRKNGEAIEKVLAVPALSASWQKSFQDLKKNAL
ncbi:MAG: MOSC domain-containing protein [Nitrospirae bacterium]|nr:MOSC domain-containing protein [Nitrospirota bacterium]